MDAAEQLAVSHPRLSRQELYEKNQRGEGIDYYNSKRLNGYHKSGPSGGELLDNYKALTMTNSRHFGNVGINTSVSAVHVPTNVYDGGKNRNRLNENVDYFYEAKCEAKLIKMYSYLYIYGVELLEMLHTVKSGIGTIQQRSSAR